MQQESNMMERNPARGLSQIPESACQWQDKLFCSILRLAGSIPNGVQVMENLLQTRFRAAFMAILTSVVPAMLGAVAAIVKRK